MVHASPDIVEAARPECQRLEYTGTAECVGQPSGDHVNVASGAGRYHPLFYAVVGWPTLLFDGVAGLYAMRGAALLLCLAMLALAFRALRRWGDPFVAVVVLFGLTPMVLYTMTVVAPNGLEMAAGVALWAALGAMAHSDYDRINWQEAGTAVVAASLLLTLRSLGPLWALFILVAALLAWPRLGQMLWRWAKTRTGIASARLLTAVAVGSIGWIVSQRSLVIGRSAAVDYIRLGERLSTAGAQIPQWILQWIGAFPYRNQPAPLIVYAAYVVLFGVLLTLAVRRGDLRIRAAILFVLVASVMTPYVITVATLEDFGSAWQGRYALPFILGLGVIVGGALAPATGMRGRQALCVVGIGLVTVGQVASVVGVLFREQRESPLSDTEAWGLAPHPAVLMLVVVAGLAIACGPLMRAAVRR
jgi:hypothetical protein